MADEMIITATLKATEAMAIRMITCENDRLLVEPRRRAAIKCDKNIRQDQPGKLRKNDG